MHLREFSLEDAEGPDSKGLTAKPGGVRTGQLHRHPNARTMPEASELRTVTATSTPEPAAGVVLICAGWERCPEAVRAMGYLNESGTFRPGATWDGGGLS